MRDDGIGMMEVGWKILLSSIKTRHVSQCSTGPDADSEILQWPDCLIASDETTNAGTIRHISPNNARWEVNTGKNHVNRSVDVCMII